MNAQPPDSWEPFLGSQARPADELAIKSVFNFLWLPSPTLVSLADKEPEASE